MSASPLLAQTIAWNANTEPDLAGYTVLYGTQPGSSSVTLDVGNVTSRALTGLQPGTTYYFRVRAYNASGMNSAPSTEVSYTVPVAGDTTPPTAPAALTATASSSTQVALGWSAATDNVGVTSYRIERCSGTNCTSFAQVATATGTSYSNTGLTASTTYRYRVRAVDGAGNAGGYSPIATATTPAAADTTPPTAPASLTATASSSSQIALSWSAATDGVGVTSYRIDRCSGTNCTSFAQVATATGTSYSNTGLTASTTYRYRVRAVDAAGNAGAYSPIATAATPAASDTTPPTVVITAPAPGSTVSGTITVSANASDAGGVTGVQFRLDGANLAAEDLAAPYSVTWNTTTASSGTHTVTAVARDAAGNATTSAAVTVTVNNAAPPGGNTTANLIGHWRFDEGAGTTARDSAGSRTGTLRSGARWVQGRLGQAVQFDGVDDYVGLGNMDVAGSALTIAAWIRADHFATDDGRIVSKSVGASEQNHYFMVSTIASGGNKLRFRLKTANGGTATLIASTGTLTAGQWIHVAATYSGTAMILFKDGVEVGRLAKTGSLTTNASVPVAIGRNPQPYGAFAGAIDDVRIYQRALSSSDIQALVTQGSPATAVPASTAAPAATAESMASAPAADATAERPALEDDGDGLPAAWERQYGLAADSPLGDDGAEGDPDGDGISNLDEYTRGSHPRGLVRSYLAEGLTGREVSTHLAITSTAEADATVLVSLADATGQTTRIPLTLPAGTRRVLDVGAIPALAGAVFSTVLESDQPVTLERQMTWAQTSASTTARGIDAPATQWHFATGSTRHPFELYYVVQNPGETTAEVQVRYLLPDGAAPVTRAYSVAPFGRTTIWVDRDPMLAGTDVAADIVSLTDTPIVVERSMYETSGQPVPAAADSGAGIATAAAEWTLDGTAAAGMTSLVIANPGAAPASVDVTLVFDGDRRVTATHVVPAAGRLAVPVSSGRGRRGGEVLAVEVRSTTGTPVIVEGSDRWR